MPGIQLNMGDHVSSEADYLPFPIHHRATMRWARERARWISRRTSGADRYFATLPLGRTLTDLLADGAIWVNYNPTVAYFGEALIGGTELSISRSALALGRWTALGTLIHELAHINGAPDHGKQAEEAVLAAGMGRQGEKGGADDAWTPYDPDIEG